MENSSNSYFDKYMEVLKLPNVQRDFNEAQKAAISKFKAKYPNADMSRFEFEVDLDLSGRVTDVVTYFKVDDDTSYEVNSDGFRSNPAYVKFLSSAIETRDGWPSIWASDGDIPAFSHLREPKHEWGIHHYPTFQCAVNLGYPLHNFRVYVSDTNYFYSKFTPIALHDWKNKSVLYENNRGTLALPSGVKTDIRTASMDFVNNHTLHRCVLQISQPSCVAFHLRTWNGTIILPNRLRRLLDIIFTTP
jgi:hypothetical protein